MRKFIHAIIVFLLVTISGPGLAALAADGSNAFDLGNTDVTILNADTKQILGHGHYQVTQHQGAILFEGENRFLDGAYDHEVQRLKPTLDGAPVLRSYKHWFFHADGAPESLDALDAKTGALACTHYNGAEAPDVRQAKVAIPQDTYVGSSQLMLLVGRLCERAATISMHTFICLPGPHLIAMKVTPPSLQTKWAMYPGNLVEVEMIPDFGSLGALAGPLIPKSYGWFDPADNYNYVGGLFDRFYTHHHLMMVRTPQSREAAVSDASSVIGRDQIPQRNP